MTFGCLQKHKDLNNLFKDIDNFSNIVQDNSLKPFLHVGAKCKRFKDWVLLINSFI